MKKTALFTAIVVALGLASTTDVYAVDASITQMRFSGTNYVAEGTLRDDTNDFGFMQSVDDFIDNPWAAVGVVYFEPGSVPKLDLDTASDSGSITNNTVPTDFGALTQTVTDNGSGIGVGSTSYTWAGTAAQGVFTYNFELGGDQIAWGVLFNWNANAGIPVLNIMTCADPQGTVLQNCVGTGTSMQTSPFTGQQLAFSGTGADFAPVAADDSTSTESGVAITIDVVANDSDKDVSASPPVAVPAEATLNLPANSAKGGILVDNGDGTVDYTSVGLTAADTDTFQYSITDVNGKTSNLATVTISITAVPNNPPTAGGGSAVVDEDSSVEILIADVATDTDVPAQPLTFVNVGAAANGTITGEGTAILTYTPSADFNGSDLFDYSVNDGFDDSAAPATITIMVDPVNDALVCTDVQKTTEIGAVLDVATADLMAACSDIDTADTLTFVSVDQPVQPGSMVEDDGAGTLTYTPAAAFQGDDSFVYTVTDGTANASANVSIQVGRLGNFTMLQSDGQKFGGTNDISFTFDAGVDINNPATLNQTEADTDFNLEIKTNGPTAFFGEPWIAHHVRVFAPGTYSFDSGCTVAEVETTGCPAGSAANSGPAMSMTIPAGMIGAHMLFDWSGSNNIDIVNVWARNAVWDTYGLDKPFNELWKAGGGISPADDTVWKLVSGDVNGDGINGIPMIEAPFGGFYVNFNALHNPIDLSVRLSHLPSIPTVNSDITYSIEVTNNAAVADVATGIEVTMALAPELTFKSAAGTDWACTYNSSPSAIVCIYAGTLSGGATTTVTIIATAPAIRGTLSNSTTITASDQLDTVSSNNTTGNKETTINVLNPIDLSVQLSHTPGIPVVNSDITYLIDVTNNAAVTDVATGIEVTMALAPELTFKSAAGTDWTCTHNSSLSAVVCIYAGTLNGGATTTITIISSAPAIGGTLTNSATITASDQVDTGSSNNTTGNKGTTINAGGSGGGSGGVLNVLLLIAFAFVMLLFRKTESERNCC